LAIYRMFGAHAPNRAQRVDEQTQIARVADDTMDTTRDQRMPRLDGCQPAEAAEHEESPVRIHE